ncbi:MAG TPA: CBS domain-containing protein [Acidimicrobiales bacterium]
MGARTNDPVRTIMGAPVVALEPETTLGTAAMVLRDKQIGALAVVGGGRLVGLLSERDVVAAVADGADTDVVTVADVMSDHPFPVSPSTTIKEAADFMLKAGVRHLPVTEADGVVGMVSIRDALDAYDARSRAAPGT